MHFTNAIRRSTEIIGGSRVVSLAKREADVALRYGSPADSELVARRVARITFGLYTSPAYRDKLNAGQAPTFIGFDQESDFIPEAAWLAGKFGDRRFSFRTNSQTTQAAAARAGYGVALLPRYIVTVHEPDLVEVSLEAVQPERDVWLLTRRDLTKVPCEEGGRRLSRRGVPTRTEAFDGIVALRFRIKFRSSADGRGILRSGRKRPST